MSLPQEVVSKTRVNIQAITDVGMARTHNEDNFIVCPDLNEKRWYLSDQPAVLPTRGCLLVVADGMGGTNAGEIASEIAVETIKRSFDALDIGYFPQETEIQEQLQQAILAAHQAIVAAAAQNQEYAGMGTTIVAGWVLPHKAFFSWVGDSRAYRWRKNIGLQLLTDDHSLVWEWVKEGKLTPDEADVHPNSNIITQSLGDAGRQPMPEFTSCSLQPGDRLLLCSDGLNNMVNHKAIAQLLESNGRLANACQELIRTANDAGGVDNVTIVALEVLKKSAKKSVLNLFGLLSV